MVSAANSFGLMDGGVDLAIISFFGKNVEKRIQSHILENYCGEQPVGTSFIIPTHKKKHPYIAHTPTMRIPQPIADTENVYFAMKAMLQAIWKFNQENPAGKIRKILCPGLGTATGKMPFKEAARQMKLAYKYFKDPPETINWKHAAKRHSEITYGGKIDYDFDRKPNI